MTAFLLTALFSAATLVAIGALAATLRQYGPAALALHRQARACPVVLEGRYTIRVHSGAEWQAQVLRPDFTARKSAPSPARDWRAAA